MSRNFSSRNLRVAHLARGAWPRLIEQTRQPPLHEALAPFAHRLVGQAEPLRDCDVRMAARAFQHNPRALGQACALFGHRAQRSSVSRSSRAELKGAIGLPVRIGVFLLFEKTPADYKLFNVLMTQDTSGL